MPLLLERFQKNNPKEKILKTLAILFLDIKGFSKFTDQQRSDALSILRSLARPMLREGGAMYINTWGDAIVAPGETLLLRDFPNLTRVCLALLNS